MIGCFQQAGSGNWVTSRQIFDQDLSFQYLQSLCIGALQP
jgi:hypothetical protein